MTAIGRREFLGGAAALGLSGCAAQIAPVGPLAPLVPVPGGALPSAAMLSAMAEQILAEYPENATAMGIDTGARAGLRSRLTDRTPAGRARLAAWARARLAALRSVDISDLSRPSALDTAVALQAHEITDEGYRFNFGDVINLDGNWGYRNTPYVVNQLSGAFAELPDFLDSRHLIENAEDAEAFADRVDAYAANIDGETGRLLHDRGVGVVSPDFLLDKTIRMIEVGATTRPDDHVLVKAMAKAQAAGKASEALAKRVREAVGGRINPALERQVAELRRHRAIANPNPGVWDLREGDAYYRWALKAATTSRLSAIEIHELGREQNKVIVERMDAILRKQGVTGGTVGERYAALSRDPRHLFPNTAAGREQLLAYINGKVADIRTRLPRAFATLVPGRLVVKRVPIELEASAPGGYAGAGTLDGSVPGQYYINLRDTAEWPRFSLPTLTYHEGIPGHIWQGEYSNRAPLIRSLLAFNAYSEGWALYAEQLADELGAYDGDPLGALGYLQSMNFRACRLVVDTGLHALRWGRAQAIQYFVDVNGDDRSSVETEVDRYCAWPGQACGYKVGHLEIVRLRDKAKAAMGARYDLRTFNDAVVKGGAVPMTLLETVIESYIGGRSA